MVLIVIERASEAAEKCKAAAAPMEKLRKPKRQLGASQASCRASETVEKQLGGPSRLLGLRSNRKGL